MVSKTILTHVVMLMVLLTIGSQASAQFIVSGEVTDLNSDPVANVDVFLYDEFGNPIGIPPTVTDASGFYSISGLPSGTFGFEFVPPSASGLLSFLDPAVSVNNNVNLDVTLEWGISLSGFVRDTLGVGIPGIDLNIYDQVTGDKLDVPNDNADSQGHYSVFVPAGTFILRWRAVGVGADPWVTVEIENVGISSDTVIDVQLILGVFVSGTVTNNLATPVLNANLDFIDAATGIEITTPNDNTNVSGFYKVAVPRSTYNVRVVPQPIDRLLVKQISDIVINSTHVLDISLDAGILVSGTVTRTGGAVVAGVDIDVIDNATGKKLVTPGDDTNDLGVYEVVIPSGTFDFEYQPPPASGLASLRVEDQVIGADATINVTLPDGVVLSGHIETASGISVQAVDIDLEDSATGAKIPLAGDRTDALGNFMTVVVAGVYDIEIEPPLSTRHAAEKLLSVSLSNDTSIFVVLDTGMQVTGIVTDSIGGALGGTKLTATYAGTSDTVFVPSNKTDSTGGYEVVLKVGTYDLYYRADTLTGLSDPVILSGTTIAHDTLIDVQFGSSGNNPPVIVPIDNQVIAESELLVLHVISSDIESTPTLESSALPSGALFVDSGNGNGSFEWTPDTNQSGIYDIWVYATDSDQATTEEFVRITVTESGQCCVGERGDMNMSGSIDVSDLTYVVEYLFSGGPPPICEEEGDINASGSIDVSDLTFIVDYLFAGGVGPADCQ